MVRGRAAMWAIGAVLVPAAVVGQGRELRFEELERVGSPGAEFARISDVVVDGAGVLWIADGMAGELYRWESGVLRRLASAGEGPGELRPGPVELVLLPGDTVLVVEPHARRWSVFGPGGGFVATEALAGLEALTGGWRWLGGGELAARVYEQTAIRPGAPPPTAGDPIVVFDRSGRRVRTVLTLPVSETFRMGAQGMPAITLLAAEPLWDADAGRGLLVASTASRRVTLYRSDGSRATLLDEDAAVVGVPHAMEAKARELLRETLAGRRMPPPVVDQLVRTASLAQRLPVVGAVLFGPDGTIWVQDGARSAEELTDLELPGGRVWQVFGGRGNRLGRATLPAGFRAMDWQGPVLYGIQVDELGRTSAVALRLIAAGAGQ